MNIPPTPQKDSFVIPVEGGKLFIDMTVSQLPQFVGSPLEYYFSCFSVFLFPSLMERGEIWGSYSQEWWWRLNMYLKFLISCCFILSSLKKASGINNEGKDIKSSEKWNER